MSANNKYYEESLRQFDWYKQEVKSTNRVSEPANQFLAIIALIILKYASK